jgi:hypothetical protein
MRIVECLTELVCHVRWLTNYIITQVNPSVQIRYPADIEAAKQIRHVLSKSFTLVESISEVPNNALNHLCDGALYLIAGEALLGLCPPTMHQFLSQTSLQRHESSQQAQLLVVRWFIAAKLFSAEDLLQVVFGTEVTVASYPSEYDAHMAIAKHLAEPDPFFLGAHVTVLRALLLHYCSTLLTRDDVVNHIALINPSATAELHTLEHTMLFWLRAVLGSVLHKCTAANELTVMDDLYLHTNDGRVVSLVINFYSPDLMPVSNIHLAGPVTVWERQENWSNIIRAAESLGLWVGIYADEIVAHGFSMLQYHVLRVVQELFAVLASSAEQSYDSLSQSVQETTELEGNTTFVDADTVHSIMGGVNFETFQPDLVADGDFVGAPAEQIDTDESEASPSALRSRELTEAAAPITVAGAEVGSPPNGDENDDEDGDLDEYDNTGEEFGVIMTGMFLQGIGIPIHRQETKSSEVETAVVPVDITPTSELRKSAIDAPSTPPPPALSKLLDQTAETVDDASTFEVHDVLRPDSQLDTIGSPSVGGIDASPIPSAGGDVLAAPQRTNSPSVSGNDRKAVKQREFNALSASLAHFRKLRPQTVGGPAAGRASVAVVQGSIDTEGIEDLLQQLSALGTSSRPPITSDNLKEQNLKMQWALEEQQRQIRAMVDRLRTGIRKAEFSAIVKHLKGSKQQGRGGCSPQSDQVRLSFASLPPRSEQPLLTDRSVQGVVEDIRKSQQVARIPPSLVVANPPTIPPPQQEREQILQPPPAPSGTDGSSPTAAVARAKVPPRADGVINVSVTALRQKNTPSKIQPVPSPSKPPPLGDQILQIPQLQKLRERHQQRQEAKTAAAAAAATAAASNKNSPRNIQQNPGSKGTPPAQEIPAAPVVGSSATTESTAVAPPLTQNPTGIVPLLAPVIKMRSNKLGITNALKHVLLTGSLNKTVLDNALKVLHDFSEKDNNQFVILLKDEYAHQFRGIYVVKPDNSIIKIFGAGPTNALTPAASSTLAGATVTTGGVAVEGGLDPKFYKFDSSSKKFQLLPSKSINQMTDALVFSGLKQPPKERERW